MASELYDSFIADYYDESPVVSKRWQDVAFYRAAARDFGDPILELGCGTGRITMTLAEAGKRITGLDLSERMQEPVHMREMLVTEYKTDDGRQVRISERVAAFHRAEQRNDLEMIFSIRHPDGRQEKLVFAWTLRYFFRYEIEHLLARCGFRVTALYGNFDRSTLADSSPEMIYVAEAC